MAGDRVALDVADAALVFALGAGPIRRAGSRLEAPVARKGVQTVVETHLARGRVMVLDQRPRIVEQHLLRHPAKALERALHAVEPGRLPLVPEGLHKRPSRIAKGRDLLALANQERALVLEAWAERTVAARTVQVLLRNSDTLIEGTRVSGRVGYQRGSAAALSFRLGFRVAYQLYKRFAIARFLADRLGERFEVLLFTRLLITELIGFTGRRLHPVFGPRIAKLAGKILASRLRATSAAVEALRQQYPDLAGRSKPSSFVNRRRAGKWGAIRPYSRKG